MDVDDLEHLEEYDLLNTDSEDSRSDGERDGARDDSEHNDGAPDLEGIYAELKATAIEIVSALGGLEEQASEVEQDDDDENETGEELVYIIGDDCLRCLRDLRNIWRDGAEDPERIIARVFADVGVLQNLIPLLLKTAGEQANPRHQKIALACTDLLTSITWPIDAEREVKEAAQRGEDTSDLAHLFSLEQTMVRYKAALLRQSSGEVGSKSTTAGLDVLSSVMRFVLLPSLAKARHHRTERDLGTISMCLHMFRNLLAIRDPVATTLSSTEQISNAGLQSELICAMSRSHILDTLLMLANSAESRDFAQWNTITAECFYIVFGGESASGIAEKADTAGQGSWRSQQSNHASAAPASSSKSSANASALRSFLTAEAHEKRMALGSSGSSRHSRFGTTLSFYTAEGERRVARNASSLRKTVDELRTDNVTRSRRKIRRRRKAREQGAPSVVRPQWTPAARTVLRDVADRLMLSNGFETLTRSIIGDIRSERGKAGDLEEARVRLMILSSFFLDYFLHRRTTEVAAEPPALQERDVNAVGDHAEPAKVDKGKARATSPALGEGEERPESTPPSPTSAWTFSLLAEWLKPWSFKMVLVRAMSAIEDKGWLELSASLQLWMSLLKLIDALSRSDSEAERDVAESLQANHFYHKETLDICSSISRCFKTQSFDFLQTMIAFVYIMPKMLEKYATNKEHIFVRVKRNVKRSRANAQQQDGEDEEPRGTEDEETAERVKVIYSERRFSFDEFQGKLCNRPLVEACVAYLGRWRDMQRPSEQLNHVVSIMHRVAIKANDVRSFYPAHIRLAFSALLKGPLVPAMEPRAPVAAKDAKKLMEFVLKRFDKLPAEEKAAWGLGLKPPKKVVEKALKLPREIEVKPGRFSFEEAVGIAVGFLAEKKMLSRVMWIKEALEAAYDERSRVVDQIDGIRLLRELRGEDADDGAPPTEQEQAVISDQLSGAIPSEEATTAFQPYDLTTRDRDETLTHDATTSPPLKLLCRLMGFEADEDDVREWKWRIPANILPTHLQANADLLEQWIKEPFELPAEVASFELLTRPVVRRRQPKPPSAGTLVPEDLSSDGGYTSSDSDSDGDASDVGQKQRKRQHKRRQDLKGDKRKKKGYRRRPVKDNNGPLFLGDDMIDSDEEEQIEALWTQRQGGGGAGREGSASESSSTPPTSPSAHSAGAAAAAATSKPVAKAASKHAGINASRTTQALFLGSDDEEDEEDEEEEDEADATVRGNVAKGHLNRTPSPSPSPLPSPSAAQTVKRRAAAPLDLDSDADVESDGETMAPTQQSRAVKRRHVVLDDDDE